jgi:Cu2+-exporting ATPase
VSDVTIAPGRGVEGRVAGVLYRIGRAEYVHAIAAGAPGVHVAPDDDARTTLVLGDATGPLAAFFLADRLRADAAGSLRALRALGLETSIASGDRAAVVVRVARVLDGIDARAGASAQDKLALVRALQARGQVVAMVGDGINDAPVLAGADVSVAIGSGTDLAKVSADLVMIGAGLAPLASGIGIARRTLRIVRENLAWAIVYNAIAVPLAASGRLAPWMAALGMSCSSLLVVANALRLLRVRRVPATAAPAHDEVAQT